MIECIRYLDCYKSLGLQKNKHAYLFYSSDKIKNDEVALFFARSFICNENSSCGLCDACKQFSKNTHPDLYIINQTSVKVEDVKKLMEKLDTKPISAPKKVFVILNFDTVNEISQNKLLKSLEEPNQNNVFILTTTKMDKILPTVLSRVSKVYIDNLSENDRSLLSSEYKEKNIDFQKLIQNNLSLTEMINMVCNKDYSATIKCVSEMFENLNTTADIPVIVSNIPNETKQSFFACMQDVVLASLDEKSTKFDIKLLTTVRFKFPKPVLIKASKMIEEAHIKQNSNVNFNYILDNLLFNILKEKFLCK
ncbi:MAG: AAA family ATPase [Clostridia bacterium]|nr:AAA family ATPase [Clostridia bacterium]